LWELIFDEDAALGSSEVGATLLELLSVEWLVNYADSRSAINCNPNHASDVIQMSFGEAFSTIEGIDPNDHVFLIELVRKFVVIVVGFRCRLSVD